MMGMLMGAQLAGTAGGVVQQSQQGATPPPLPNPLPYYIGNQGHQSGPFSLAQLREQALQRTFDGSMLVWKKGMAAWQPASEVSELADILSSVPPPLP